MVSFNSNHTFFYSPIINFPHNMLLPLCNWHYCMKTETAIPLYFSLTQLMSSLNPQFILKTVDFAIEINALRLFKKIYVLACRRINYN